MRERFDPGLAGQGGDTVDRTTQRFARKIEKNIAPRAFRKHVQDLSVTEVASWNRQAKKNPPCTEFGFVPISSKSANYSLTPAAYSHDIRRESVETAGWRLYLDSSRAIGLVHQGTLCALGAAGIDRWGRVHVNQLQGRPCGSGVTPGLERGLLWRRTLVQAWIGIGKAIGANEIVVQAASNSNWIEVRPEQYDKVAEEMQFKRSETTNNWHRAL